MEAQAEDDLVRTELEVGQRVPEEFLDFDAPAGDKDLVSKESPHYELSYAALHKAACRTCTFSGDGNLFATGSSDGSVRVGHHISEF